MYRLIGDMQVVWYENKALVFTSEIPSDGEHSVHITDIAELSPANLLQKFENSNILYVITEDAEQAFAAFSGNFTMVEAAGGLIENDKGDILIMRRRGWWDLPKGHIEKGETPEQAAIREVHEETGLNGVRLLEPLGTTLHFYNTYGRWELKRTWWFRITYDGSSIPTPQSEEGITELLWLNGAELHNAVNASYGTIRSVFGRYSQLTKN